MDSTKEITLTELFFGPLSEFQTLVVKGLPDEVDKDLLENYLEVVCHCDVTAISFSRHHCGIAVVTFENEVKDHSSFDGKKSLLGRRPLFESLGEARGVFLLELPGGLTADLIELYFESPKKSGGDEAAVDAAATRLYRGRDGTYYGRVVITDNKILKRILSQPLHKLQGYTLQVEPYYPCFHDYLLSKWGVTECTSTESSKCTPKVQQCLPVVYKRASECLAEEQEHNASSMNQDHIPKDMPKAETENAQVKQLHNRVSPSRENFKPVVPPRPLSQSMLHSVPSKKTEAVYPMGFEQPASLPVQRGKLNIIFDGEAVPRTEPQGPDSDQSTIVRNPQTLPSRKPRRKNIALVRPCSVQNIKNHGNRDDGLSHDASKTNEPSSKVHITSRDADRRRPVFDLKQMETEKEFPFRKEHKLRKVTDIPLLRIAMFARKLNSASVRVTLIEDKCTVLIETGTNEELNAVILNMYETLGKVKENSMSISKERCKFLSFPETKSIIRSHCIRMKVKAVLHADTDQRTLTSFAYTDEDVEKGLQFVQKIIFEGKVSLRDGQKKLMSKCKEWTSLMEKLNTKQSLVYVDNSEDKIIIECLFDGSRIDRLRKQIVPYLQQLKGDQLKKIITLEGARAACFSHEFRNRIIGNVKRQHGTIDVRTVSSKYPMKLEIEVEGEEKVLQIVTDCVDSMKPQALDFSRISSDSGDIWLMMKGLDTNDGRQFFKDFQKLNDCFIDVTKNGEIPAPSVQTIKGATETDDSSSDSSDDNVDNVGEVQEADTGEDRSVPDTDLVRKKQEIQYGLSDREALQYALAMSLEEAEEEAPLSRTSDPFGEVYEEISVEQNCRQGFRQRTQNYSAFRRPPSSYGQQLDESEQPIYEDAYIPRRIQAAPAYFASPLQTVCADSTYMVNRIKVVLRKGMISDQKVDCIVNIVSKNWALEESEVSKGIVRKAGDVLRDSYQMALQNCSTEKTVVTDPGNLNCTRVVHARFVKGDNQCRQSISQVMQEISQVCLNEGLSSLAMPPLGVGRMYGYSASESAESILTGIQQYFSNTGVQVVYLVIFDKDKQNTQSKFKKKCEEFENGMHLKSYQLGRAASHQDLASARVPVQFMQKRMFPEKKTTESPLMHRLMTPEKRAIKPSLRQSGMIPTVRSRMKSNLGVDEQQQRMARPSPVRPEHIRRSSSGELRQRRHKEYDTSKTPKYKKSKEHKSKERKVRTPGKPSAKLVVTVFAKDGSSCVEARNKLGRAVKENFLTEKHVKRCPNLPKESKAKLDKIFDGKAIRYIKGKEQYSIRGLKKDVETAWTEVHDILLQNNSITENHRQRKEKRERLRGQPKQIIELMAKEEPEIPYYWKNYKPGELIRNFFQTAIDKIKQKNYIKEPLDHESHAFKTIKKLMHATFDVTKLGQGKDAVGLQGYTRLNVIKIERVENLTLYRQYANKRSAIFLSASVEGFLNVDKLPKSSGGIKTGKHSDRELLSDTYPEVNEYYVFHGTKMENVEAICNEGCDEKLCGDNAMLGRGVYGAEESMKADQYADDKNTRTCGVGQKKKMFLIRMLLGDCFLCSNPNPKKYNRAPCKSCYDDKCSKHKGRFNSVIGDNGKLFREFVVYHSDQCYPEYLITYERV